MVVSAPWPPGSASGVGSLPGSDLAEGLRTVLGETPDLPYLPELPARGPGADMIGRSSALLVDMPVELTSTGWALTDRPGRDLHRAGSMLADDLDILVELAGDYRGVFKIQVVGPWTLGAALELRNGEKALTDAGATRDLSESLAEGLARHLADVGRRLPDTTLVVQFDEPLLPAVLTGGVRSASGLRAIPTVEPSDAVIALGVVRERVPAGLPVLVHCCALAAPVEVARRAGADAVSVDFGLLGSIPEDELGAGVEAGLTVFAGVLPAVDTELSALADTVDPVRQWWRRLGFAPERLPEQVVLTPGCGLALASPAYARRAMTRCREAARALLESPEG